MYTRQIYSVLDLIGDIGGIFEGLSFFGFIFMYFFGFIFGEPLRALIVNSLFTRNPEADNDNKNNPGSTIKRIKSRKRHHQMCLLCCKRKKDKKIGSKVDKMLKELEVDHFIRT